MFVVCNFNLLFILYEYFFSLHLAPVELHVALDLDGSLFVVIMWMRINFVKVLVLE